MIIMLIMLIVLMMIRMLVMLITMKVLMAPGQARGTFGDNRNDNADNGGRQ